jgi:hypothetical protein
MTPSTQQPFEEYKLTDLENFNNYKINEARCERALSDFFKFPSIKDWVYHNMERFNTISIFVDRLPYIESCNYQRKHFGNINEFHIFFRNIMDVMDDPFKGK